MSDKKFGKNLSQYFFIVILIFFISLLSFNLFRTYTHYIEIQGKVKKISNLVKSESKNSIELEKEYKYYNSNYYKNFVATNDLNLFKSNSSEIVLPKTSTSSFINVKNKKEVSSNNSQKSSFMSWIMFLF
jgi:DNA gyrase/topoisomerase IV subunit A